MNTSKQTLLVVALVVSAAAFSTFANAKSANCVPTVKAAVLAAQPVTTTQRIWWD